MSPQPYSCRAKKCDQDQRDKKTSMPPVRKANESEGR